MVPIRQFGFDVCLEFEAPYLSEQERGLAPLTIIMLDVHVTPCRRLAPPLIVSSNSARHLRRIPRLLGIHRERLGAPVLLRDRIQQLRFVRLGYGYVRVGTCWALFVRTVQVVFGYSLLLGWTHNIAFG